MSHLAPFTPAKTTPLCGWTWDEGCVNGKRSNACVQMCKERQANRRETENHVDISSVGEQRSCVRMLADLFPCAIMSTSLKWLGFMRSASSIPGICEGRDMRAKKKSLNQMRRKPMSRRTKQQLCESGMPPPEQ